MLMQCFFSHGQGPAARQTSTRSRRGMLRVQKFLQNLHYFNHVLTRINSTFINFSSIIIIYNNKKKTCYNLLSNVDTTRNMHNFCLNINISTELSLSSLSKLRIGTYKLLQCMSDPLKNLDLQQRNISYDSCM